MVHSTEWATGSRLFGAFDLVSAFSRGASGPLDGVVHWLTTFRAFGLVSALFPVASGPLDGVVHWLTTYRAFDPVSTLFPVASGPLERVDHWLTPYRDFKPSSRLSPSLLSRQPTLFLASHQLFISSFRARRLLFGYLYMKIHFHTERRMRYATAYLGFLLLSAA